MSSLTPLNTFSICSSSSVRSVMIRTRASRTFSRIHLASQTIVRLLPLPWLCQRAVQRILDGALFFPGQVILLTCFDDPIAQPLGIITRHDQLHGCEE